MILIGCLIGAGVETVFAKKDLSNAILDGISSRLGLVEAFLNQIRTDELPRSALRIELLPPRVWRACQDYSRTRTTSRGSTIRSETRLILTGQLVEFGSNLVESAPSLSPDEQQGLHGHCTKYPFNSFLSLMRQPCGWF